MKNKFANISLKCFLPLLFLTVFLTPVAVVFGAVPDAWDSGTGGGGGEGASNSSGGTTLGDIFSNISSDILSPFIGLLLTAAVVVFFWGMVKYVYSLGEKEKAEGRWLMVWGVIALFVMISVWGLVKAVRSSLGITDNAPVENIVIP